MKKLKPNYILIPLFTLTIAILGSTITAAGMEWYKTINLPGWTPPGNVIGTVWTILFILATISALMVWNAKFKAKTRKLIFLTFGANALLNFAWSYLFFGLHFLATSAVEASLLGLSVFVLIFLIWPVKKWAAILLIPYSLWVAFATYLTFVVFQLNTVT
ncbi:hypothetical protein A2115_02795 [Candidatus Woesebacteria bacterium GWA1_41_8]|uniref:TspO protein n=1 Tax=Candidatus Woesebacteria bacterium GWA1_41_8 TaxID=1802471 RepID=A0A1F7WK50_9BACT|nr:MAG: hypothetical protein A2115_02795 [Candidatus Woesebacteria bacterium GWA1_41_8]